jgi:hypothetical protein
MNSGKKMVWFGLVSTVVGLYTTLVIQNLWNSFAVSALNIPNVSYLRMYGIVLLAGLLFQHDDFAEEQHRDIVLEILDYCVPEDKREALAEMIKQKTEAVWVALGLKVFAKIVANTIALAIGFVIHMFLV